MAVTLERQGPAGEPRRPKILCVDDEPQVLEGLRDSLRREFDVSVATSGAEGLALLRGDPTGFPIVISDMRMPNMGGADFLRAARAIAPDAVRILLTGHADLRDALRAVNGARLFRFLIKPCDPTELLLACSAALGHHRLQTSERVPMEDLVRGSSDALGEVRALTKPAALGGGGGVTTPAGKPTQHAGLPHWREVEAAPMFAHLGTGDFGARDLSSGSRSHDVGRQ